MKPFSLLFVLIFVLFSVRFSQASVRRAERDYQAGDFQRAGEHYDKAAKARSEDGRLHYNLGTSLYRERQYEAAAQAFERSLHTQDLELQQRAFYNLGVTRYQLGKGLLQSDPEETLKTWESGLDDFQNALDLGPKHEDAQYNYDTLKAKIEALKAQQQNAQDNQDSQNAEDAEESEDSENASNSQTAQNNQQNQDPSVSSKQQSNSSEEPAQSSSESTVDGERQQGEEQASAEQRPSGNPQSGVSDEHKDDQMTEPQGSEEPQDMAKEEEDQRLDNAQTDPRARENEESEATQQKSSNKTETSSDTSLRVRMSREEAQELLESVRAYERKLPVSRSRQNNSGKTSNNW